jgi:myo-inositol 2-dehydrogenase/D-chiro-inositol 1-dehydrogenase
MNTTRRSFLMTSSATLAGATLLHASPAAPRDERELKVALIGCGGRGTGAAAQALSTAGKVKLVAMADAFQDRLEGCLAELTKSYSGRLDVPESRRFVGFDAYQKAVDADVDVVLLATPPGFRPLHFAHAVSRGKHVFMEKPVAVDGPGVRQVLAAAAEAQQKNLKVGVGLQRHHDARYIETVERLRSGALGEINFMRAYWNSSGVWMNKRRPGQTEMEYQMRNWYYFNWLCGDHIVEQHIHNLDVINWVKGATPVRAQGQGGRQVRVGPDFGEIYDHHVVEYTYADESRLLSQCRHQPNCWENVSEHAHGALGNCDISAGSIKPRKGEAWRSRAEGGDPYQVEHDVLFATIREDRPHNEAVNGAHATLTAILGRMATYSGKTVTWEEALHSQLALRPAEYAWNAAPPTSPDAAGLYPIPAPGSSVSF